MMVCDGDGDHRSHTFCSYRQTGRKCCFHFYLECLCFFPSTHSLLILRFLRQYILFVAVAMPFTSCGGLCGFWVHGLTGGWFVGWLVGSACCFWLLLMTIPFSYVVLIYSLIMRSFCFSFLPSNPK